MIVDQDVSVPRLALVHILYGGLSVRHGSFLDPRLDIVLDGDLEHLFDFCRGTDEGAGNGLAEDRRGLNTGQSFFRQSDLKDVASRLQKRHVQRVEGHVGRERGAEEEVKGAGVFGEKGLGVLGDENTVGAHLFAVFFLRLAGREGKRLGAQGLGELDACCVK